jgi:Lrp/AsnC family transcriptional regulator for asnA, asnC and gidA
MLIKIYARDNRHLLRLILDKLAVIPGVANTETFQLSLEEIFRRQLSIFGEDDTTATDKN